MLHIFPYATYIPLITYGIYMSDYPLSETTNKVSLKPAFSSFIEFTMSN